MENGGVYNTTLCSFPVLTLLKSARIKISRLVGRYKNCILCLFNLPEFIKLPNYNFHKLI